MGYVVRGEGAFASGSIFLPCIGDGAGTSLYDPGSCGYYWSSVPTSDNHLGAMSLSISSSGHDSCYDIRYYGRPVRPVQNSAEEQAERAHEHVDDEKHCEWCGPTSYGSACPFSLTGKHRHGHGANKCIWCGSTSTGPACPFSPTDRHEK